MSAQADLFDEQQTPAFREITAGGEIEFQRDVARVTTAIEEGDLFAACHRAWLGRVCFSGTKYGALFARVEQALADAMEFIDERHGKPYREAWKDRMMRAGLESLA